MAKWLEKILALGFRPSDRGEGGGVIDPCENVREEPVDDGRPAMRLIGYWMESVLDERFVPPQELIGEWAPEVRMQVVQYLESGEVFERYRGYSHCRFSRCQKQNGSREFADGYWVWPEGLGHYVREHGVILPEEFVQDVVGGRARLGPDAWSNKRPDLEFWKIWCAQKRSGKFKDRIRASVVQIPQLVEIAMEPKIRALECEQWCSDAKCQWVNCTRKALRNRAFCASCSLNEERKSMTIFTAITEFHRIVDTKN